MKVKLVRIGNSRGVRIPASVIKECGFHDELEMRVEDGAVVLEPPRGVRAGWGAAFETMAAAGDDAPVLPDGVEPDVDSDDWTW